MSRVALASIRALTFYSGAETTATRRGLPAIPQLTCVGRPCSLYQPEVVRCVNDGGEGADIDWKCEADLPEALRFGRVEVSCEGWSGPGDPYVVKDSCGLEYRLVRVPTNLQDAGANCSPWFANTSIASTLFTILWSAVLLFLLYHFFKPCLRGQRNTAPRPPPYTSRSQPPGGFGGPGGSPQPGYPPPPYHDISKPSGSASGTAVGGAGFWTGLGLGGLGATALGMLFRNNDRPVRAYTDPAYDWERSRLRTAPVARPSPHVTRFTSDDRGEGSSNLGSMRRSTGLGGSNVR